MIFFTSLPSCRLSKQYKNQSRPRPSMNLFQRLPLPVLHLGKIPMLGTSKKFLHQFLLLLPDSLLPLFVPILSACYLCGISSVMSQITFGTVGSHFSSDILGRPIMAAITKVTGRSLLNQEAILIWNHIKYDEMSLGFLCFYHPCCYICEVFAPPHLPLFQNQNGKKHQQTNQEKRRQWSDLRPLKVKYTLKYKQFYPKRVFLCQF